MNSVSEQTYPQWLNESIYHYLQDYTDNKITRDETVLHSILVMLNSYKMLSIWKSEEGSVRNEENKAECAIAWKTFCNTTSLGKAAIKVIISTQLAETKVEADKFANENNCTDLFTWLEEIDGSEVEARLLEETKSDENRPFFSLVIACYNDGRYEKGVYLDRLLNSLCEQGIEKDELEVILSDDCSPVPFDDIVDSYKDRLYIKRTKTDYNFAPGNTRQKGIDIMTGKWLCFADHDDIYYPGALAEVKKFIADTHQIYYVFSPFNGVTPDGMILKKYDKILGWCHGKFYNVDNFWKPQHIHFIKDLKSHEDIAICTQVSCALDKMKVNIENCYLGFTTYAWTDNPQSVSHAKYTVETETGPRHFLEVHYDDYLKSTGYIYVNMAKEGLIDNNYGYITSCEVLCYAYAYQQIFMFQRKDYWKENLVNAGRFLNLVKDTFGIAFNSQIYDKIAANNGTMFYRVRALADNTGRYIPQQGFKQWLEAIDKAYKNTLTK